MSKINQNEIFENEVNLNILNEKLNNKLTNNANSYLDQNIQNKSFNASAQLPKNIIYKKPTIKIIDTSSNNINNSINNNEIIDNNNFQDYSQLNNNQIIKDKRIKEMSNNLKENEIKLEKVNKTMIDLLNKKKDDLNNISSFSIQNNNDIEKIQQENLTLKADSIIYREDIIHLTEINKKLTEELELEKRKIYDLISKGEESLQILTNKNYEITQLTETISNLQLSNSPTVLNNIKDNRTKDQIIYELQFKLHNLNNDKIRIETEKKILEEQYKNTLNEKNIAEKEDENYKYKMNYNINGLENKIKDLEKKLEELSLRNNELKINNQKINQNIEMINFEKYNLQKNYEEKKEQYTELDNEYKKLENKYSQLLYDIQKQKFINQKMKNEERKENKRKKNKSCKKLIINDLYDKIQMLKQKVKNEKSIDS